MRRDLGSEVVAAIAAVALLAFAIAFGILLSVSNTETELEPTAISATLIYTNTLEPTPEEPLSTAVVVQATVEPTDVEVPMASNTMQPTETNTRMFTTEGVEVAQQQQVALSATPNGTKTPTSPSTPTATATTIPELTVTKTNTPTPSDTVTNTSTATNKPTATNTPMPTDTAVPSHTPTFTSTVSDTPVPTDTATSTPTSTASDTPTNTSSPTQEPTATNTSTATDTPEPTDTATYTATPSATFTLTTTPSNTPSPTATSGILPTAREDTAGTADIDCGVPGDWPIYVVQETNSLEGIAQAVELSPQALINANCLEEDTTIVVGQELFVPDLPFDDIPRIAGVDEALERQSIESVACEGEVTISSPQPGSLVSEDIVVLGSAESDEFSYYKLEIRPDEAITYYFYLRSNEPVETGKLGTISRDDLDVGLYWIRLVVVDEDRSIQPTATCVISVLVE